MNSNLRSMIDSALDDEYYNEDEFSYVSDSDLSGAYGGDEIEKLASALNYVATNLDDLGTTDEKLAELELLQEKLANATGDTTKATTETLAKGEGKGMGDFFHNLRGDSSKSLGTAWKQMGGVGKGVIGGGGALLGLGALYGGAKLLGGGDKQTNVVKVSSLQDAKQRALVKMAEHYNIPVWELEKLALSPRQDQILTGLAKGKQITEVAKPAEGAAASEIQAYNQYQRQMASRQRAVANIIGDGKGISDAQRKALDTYAKGGRIDYSTVGQIRETLAASPTSADAIRSGDRVLGARQSPDPAGAGMTRNRQGSIVPANNVERTLSDGTKVQVPAKYRDLPVKDLETRLKLAPGDTGKITAFKPSEGKALEIERKVTARESTTQLQQKRQAIADQRSARQAATGTRLEQKAQRGAQMERAAVRNQLLGSQSRSESKALRNTLKSGVDKILEAHSNKVNPKLTPSEMSALKGRFGDNFMLVVRNAGSRGTEQAAASAQQTRRRSGVKGGRQANVESAATQGRRTGGIGNKAAGETAEAAKGFFAKNRRALLGAGAAGLAGLAGYGAYRAFGGGGQSKAASYRGMRKLAEDRISPARIRGGRADAYSGFDLHAPGMSRSAHPHEPIRVRAQRVRDRVNSDMKSYVRNIGGGYHLDRYLNRFNK